MVKMYSKPKQESISRTGLEVYLTDEDNFHPYVSSGVKEDTSSSSGDGETTNTGFSYHQGEVKEIYHYANLESTSHEYDYTEMKDSATLKIPSVDKNRFYKGVRLCLSKQWEAPSQTLNWEDLDSVLTGFINDQTFSEDGVEIKVDGYSILLDQKFKFEFTNMKRSKILEEIILTAGLVPIIDVTGLDDDVTKFTTSSSKKESSSSSSGESTGSASIDEAVNKAIDGISDDLKKAKAIDKAFKNHIYYKYYFNCRFSDIDKAWKNGHLNCADGANVLCAMFKAGGLKAVIVHVPGHYIVKVKIGGKTYYTDNAASSGSHTTRAFGDVWRGVTSGSEVGEKISA